MSCPKCFPMSFANLSKGITWCLPGSAQCLSSQYLSDRVWSVSIRAGSHLSLSANVCYEEPADVYQDWTRVSSCWCLSSELNQCLTRSVSQCLLPIYLKGSLDVFQDQPNVFLPVSVWWVWSVSIWAGSQLCLSVNVLLWESCWCLPGLNSCVCLPMSF